MAHLIDKDALVAEIEKIYRQYEKQKNFEYMSTADFMCIELKKILSLINTLEVAEVDLDIQTFAKEMDTVFALPSSETKNTEENPFNWEFAIAKHFFELGMSVSNKAQKGE